MGAQSHLRALMRFSGHEVPYHKGKKERLACEKCRAEFIVLSPPKKMPLCVPKEAK